MLTSYNDTQDVFKAYAERRKNVSQEEVEDLYKCLIWYIKKTINKNDSYAIRIPRIGYLHKKLDFEPRYTEKTNSLYNRMLLDSCTNRNKKNSVLLKKDLVLRYYGEKSKVEITEIHNESN